MRRILPALALAACATTHVAEVHARISKPDAAAIAMTKAPAGSVVEQAELEEENGKLVWSFDLRPPRSGDVVEVQVDAATGAIVSVKMESPSEQERERRTDRD